MGMSSIVKGEDRKMELWISGQSDIYRWLQNIHFNTNIEIYQIYKCESKLTQY